MPGRRPSPMLKVVADAPCDLDLTLPDDETAAAVARGEVRRRLTGVLDPARLTDLLIIVVELVTNAVVHGRGDVRMRLRLDGGDVRGEVIDAGGGFEYQIRAV